MGLGGRRIVAHQPKDFLRIVEVLLPGFHRLGIVFQIVIAIGKTQAALIDRRNDLGGVVQSPGSKKIGNNASRGSLNPELPASENNRRCAG